MAGSKRGGNQIEQVVAQAVDYEITLADVVRRSERRAWFVASAALLMSLILAGGYYLVLPLKERTPFLVMADPYRGTATVAQLRGDFSKNSIVANEAVNKSNLAHYVIARESYDIAQRDIRDWTVIFTMSTQGLANEYRQLYSRNNPNNLITKFGRNKAVRVEIISITLLDSAPGTSGAGTGGGDAAVRFQRVLLDKTSGGTSIFDTRVANIRYTYNKALALTEQQRIENPLGFQVTSYRVDTEMVSSPVLPDGSLPGQPATSGLPQAQGMNQIMTPPTTSGALPNEQQLPAGSPSAVITPADPRAQQPPPASSASNSTNGVPGQ